MAIISIEDANGITLAVLKDRYGETWDRRDFHPGEMVYTKSIRWREQLGLYRIAVGSGRTMARAEGLALERALEAGWTPRRWWQWRRWGENG